MAGVKNKREVDLEVHDDNKTIEITATPVLEHEGECVLDTHQMVFELKTKLPKR